jgi:hypothetical protein
MPPPKRHDAEGRKAPGERPVGTADESATGSVFLFSRRTMAPGVRTLAQWSGLSPPAPRNLRTDVLRPSLLAAFAFGSLFAACFASGGTASTGQIVLGSKTSFLPSRVGWGTPKPRLINNGGDPSGIVSDIRWRNWGQSTATANGVTWLDPTLTRGWVRGRAQLRASRIGRCSSRGPRAYTRLEGRVAPEKGGRFSSWMLWNGRPNLCHP